MRKRILGAIGVAWGFSILLGVAMARQPAPTGNPAFDDGRKLGDYTSLAFGVVLFVSGLYYLIKRNGHGPNDGNTDSGATPPTI